MRIPVRIPSPALVRLGRSAGVASVSEASLFRRLSWIWGLLFLNVLPYTATSALIPLPSSVGKVITQGALAGALLLAVFLNRRVLVRPNIFLVLMTILCVSTMMMSVHGYFGLGSVYRAARLLALVGGLWLITPWWGRDDLLVLRCYRRVLSVIVAVVLVGIVVAPGHAFAQGGRLSGTIWPMPPTQVAHYVAILAGTTVILWFTGLIRSRSAALLATVCIAVVLLTHTRTALFAMVAGIAVAGISLLLTRQRVRRVLAVTIAASAIVALSFAPFLTTWLTRGESHHQLSNLTGRTTVWSELVAQPRSEVNTVFGYGMSNNSFNGLSIDSGWLSVYLDQGLFGDAVVGGQLLFLLIAAAFSPRGPRRALALFLVVYVALASITETGIGQASPYLLDLAVAASVLMAPPTAAAIGPGRDVEAARELAAVRSS